VRLGHLSEELARFDPQASDQSIPERFEKQVVKTPNHIAIKDRDYALTYNALNQTANQIARAVLAENRESNEPIALLFEFGAPSIIAIMAALKCGKIAVSLDPSYPHERLSYFLDDSQAEVILTNRKNLSLALQLAKEGQKIINVDEIDINLSNETLSLSISPEDIAFIFYTSGSTGLPKGVMQTHRSIHHRVFGITPEDHVSYMFSASFGAIVPNFFGALLTGATLYPYNVKEQGYGRLVDWLIQEEITFFHPPTSVIGHLNEALDRKTYFPKIRIFDLGGKAIYSRDVKRFRKYCSSECITRTSLSATEVGRIAQFFIESDTEISSSIVPAGYPCIDKNILILDENGQELGFDQDGEIAVSGRYISPGYWRDAELTEEKFIVDPNEDGKRIYLTGDMGRMHPDGLLEHLGRKDFQVKIRGHRVEVAEIEATMLALDIVEQVAIKAHVKQSNGEKYLAAYLVPASQPAPTVPYLRSVLAETLPNYMIPTRFIMMEKLPLTSTGKVDRPALPTPDPGRPDLGLSFVAPGDELETKITNVWEDLLDVKPIGIDDDFFDLGGDSLNAAQLFVEIEKVFHRKLPLSILYEAATVRQQAVILRQKDYAADWSPLVSVRVQGSKPPLFCIPGKGGNPIRFRHITQRLDDDRPVYMLQYRGISGNVSPYTKVEDIATDFIEEIRKVQPNGPYNFCGSSGGGVVVYEMAQQLRAQGEEVGLLAFVDTYGPGYPSYLPGITRTKVRVYKAFDYLSKHINNLWVANWRGRGTYMRHYNREFWKQFTRFGRWVQGNYEGFRSPPIPPELRKVEAANLVAVRSYEPQPYAGKVILFRASEQPKGIYPDPTLGWGTIGIEDLEVHEIPGHHGSILFEPRVGKLADILVNYLA